MEYPGHLLAPGEPLSVTAPRGSRPQSHGSVGPRHGAAVQIPQKRMRTPHKCQSSLDPRRPGQTTGALRGPAQASAAWHAPSGAVENPEVVGTRPLQRLRMDAPPDQTPAAVARGARRVAAKGQRAAPSPVTTGWGLTPIAYPATTSGKASAPSGQNKANAGGPGARPHWPVRHVTYTPTPPCEPSIRCAGEGAPQGRAGASAAASAWV